MKMRLAVFTILAIVMTPVVVLAAPISGTYKTLTATILPGHATESMPADLAEGQIGNMVWAESWDGAVLGTNWKVMCPAIAAAPVLLFDTVDGDGNGQRAYQTTYYGGTLWLSKNGAWGGGDLTDYTGTLTSFSTVVYKQYVNFNQVGAVTNINLTGVFDQYTDCFEMAIANAELVGYTPVGFLVPGLGPFPAFHGPSDCDVIGSHGTYWDVHDVTLSILGECVVPIRNSSWGAVKAIYR